MSKLHLEIFGNGGSGGRAVDETFVDGLLIAALLETLGAVLLLG